MLSVPVILYRPLFEDDTQNNLKHYKNCEYLISYFPLISLIPPPVLLLLRPFV